MAFNHSPVDLDRALARAAGQWRGWQQRLRTERELDQATEDDPLAYFRPVTGLSMFRELDELPAHDPLRVPFRRWVLRLAEQRVNHAVRTRLEVERRRPRDLPDAPVRGRVSVAGMLQNCMSDVPRRSIWMRLFFQHAQPVSVLEVELWQRRGEFARRMALKADEGLDSVFSAAPAPAAQLGFSVERSPEPAPGQAPLSPEEGGPAFALELARRLASVTRERVRELAPRAPEALLSIAVGGDVPGDWPARLTPERLRDYFRDTDLLRALDLRGEALPPSIGAASFCRALGNLGSAWHEALAPSDQPFVVAHDAYGLGRQQAAALFAGLPLNPGFLRRYLDIAKHAVGDVQRRLAQLWLVDLALAALRVQLRAPALAGERAFREAFADLAQRELSISVPRAAAGALFRLGVEDEQRLVGRLLAVKRELELVEAHDEDWFRNPRAIEQLRAEAHRPPELHADAQVTAAALKLVTRRLEALLR